MDRRKSMYFLLIFEVLGGLYLFQCISPINPKLEDFVQLYVFLFDLWVLASVKFKSSKVQFRFFFPAQFELTGLKFSVVILNIFTSLNAFVFFPGPAGCSRYKGAKLECSNCLFLY